MQALAHQIRSENPELGHATHAAMVRAMAMSPEERAPRIGAVRAFRSSILWTPKDPRILSTRPGVLTPHSAGTGEPEATEEHPMTSPLPHPLAHLRGGPDAVKRAAQRVIHVEEIALGFAAVSVWSYAVLTLLNG